MDKLTLSDQFIDLRSISDNVDDYLSRELYKDSFGYDTDYTPNDVLQECYTIVLQELRELGIQFTVDLDDLLHDWFTAKHIYYIRKIADAYELTQLCKKEDTKNFLDTLLQAPEEESDIFVALVMHLAQKYPTEPMYRYVADFGECIQSTDRFVDHVKSILESLKTQDLSVETPDIRLAKSYIAKIQGLRTFAEKATKMIIEGMQLQSSLNMKTIRKLLDEYDMDKLSPDALPLYSIIDNPEAETLYPNLGTFKETMMQKHHERAYHHLEHWLKYRDPRPTKENLILLIAHCYEPDSTAPSFWKEVDEMINNGVEIFDPEDVTFMLKAANCIFPRSQQVSYLSISEDE